MDMALGSPGGDCRDEFEEILSNRVMGSNIDAEEVEGRHIDDDFDPNYVQIIEPMGI